ncbi:hypothetical protein D7252_14045 [Microbacterium sp. CGR2]|nr:hypothetical protein D7252_14045 [Microbacterium sp. CGR2]
MTPVQAPRWTRLLVRIGIGRARRTFLGWLDGPHLRDQWRRSKQIRAFEGLRALDAEICASMNYQGCCDMHDPATGSVSDPQRRNGE